jgi:hypothetical protein
MEGSDASRRAPASSFVINLGYFRVVEVVVSLKNSAALRQIDSSMFNMLYLRRMNPTYREPSADTKASKLSRL